MFYRLLFLCTVLPLAILGCTNKSDELADSLPLDENRPTFIVFYADF